MLRSVSSSANALMPKCPLPSTKLCATSIAIGKATKPPQAASTMATTRSWAGSSNAVSLTARTREEVFIGRGPGQLAYAGLLAAENRFELLQELLDIGGVSRRGRRRHDRMELGEPGQRADRRRVRMRRPE